MKDNLFLAAFLLSVIFQYNCSSTRQVLNDYELRDKDKPSSIYVFTKDSILYEMTNYKLQEDSVLSGSGYKIINDKKESYEGEIQLNEIKYILTREGNFWKSAIAVGIIGYIGITGISYLSEEKDFRMWERITYPYNSDPSCPFIFSWDGERYILEGEAFGISLSKSLEMKTSHILSSLNTDKSIANIKLSNERPETHYFNQVELKAIEVDKDAEVYADVNNQFWQVEKMITPFIAKDNSGNNITQRIINKDNNYWESDLTNINSGFEDAIELEFIKDKSLKDGELVINAINTNLSQKVFEFMGGYLGDQVLQFYNSLETDPEMISIFKNWVKEVSLKAFVWNRDRWKEIGFIYPEANAISFSKIIPFNFESINNDTIKIMLKSLTGVWKIDAVQMGVKSNLAHKIIDIPFITAMDNNQKDIIELLKNPDNKYKMLLPSEYIKLSFNPGIPSKENKIIYALNVQGYLYEWMGDKTATSEYQFVNINRSNKINYLKKLLKYKSVFLPQIYSAWEKEKINVKMPH